MSTPFPAYEELCRRMREIAWVGDAAALLGWDQETYMPAKALAYRADQLAHLSGWTHHQATAPEVGRWIGECEQHGFSVDTKEFANVREWRRTFNRQTKLPPELVEDLHRTTTLAREAWVDARARTDFARFRPHLEKIVALNRRMADLWGHTGVRYDALVEEYEPGVTTAQLRQVFTELRPEIVRVLGPAMERSASVPADLLEGDYPAAAQAKFNREVAAAVGFDFEAGRIDTTTHPFCSGLGPGDTRLTTRYNERDFSESLYGVLHETGHGLYDQGLSAADHGLPTGSAVSLGIHESQSRLWENHVGRSVEFWQHWHPVACGHFPNLRRFTPEQIAAALNRVEPSFIRVEADQVTYDLHVILRFEIEHRLIGGEIEAGDVPALWNEEFHKMLGLRVPSDREGCLQDIHWSLGSFGYFPTYTLGNLNAAQLFTAAARDIPDLRGQMARGGYGDLLGWLRSRVHEHGQRHRPQDLMQRATGEATSARHHLEHLRTRFGAGS